MDEGRREESSETDFASIPEISTPLNRSSLTRLINWLIIHPNLSPEQAQTISNLVIRIYELECLEEDRRWRRKYGFWLQVVQSVLACATGTLLIAMGYEYIGVPLIGIGVGNPVLTRLARKEE